MISFIRTNRERKKSQTGTFTGFDFKKLADEVDWVLAVGFALFQAWNILCVAMPDPLTYESPFLDLRWLSLLTAGTISVVVVIWPRLIQLFLSKKKNVFLVGAIATAGSILGPISAYIPDYATLILLLAAIAVGIGFVGLFFAWFKALTNTYSETTLVFGIMLAALLTYPLANILKSGQINIWVAALTASVLPIGSVLLFGLRLKKNSELLSAKDGSSLPSLESEERSFLFRFCLCIFLVVAAIEIVRGILFFRGRLDLYAGAINFYILALKLLSGFYILVVLKTHNASKVTQLYRVIFLIILSIALCLLLPLRDTWLVTTLVNYGSFCFQVIMTTIAYRACIMFRGSSYVILGSIRAAWAFAGILGIVACKTDLMYCSEMMQELVFILCLVIAISFVFVFPDRMCADIFVDRSESVANLKVLYEQVAREFNLTERETEVFLFMIKGRSASRIAKELSISVATVNSHIYHIYQKTSVHSNQELLDLVESRSFSE